MKKRLIPLITITLMLTMIMIPTQAQQSFTCPDESVISGAVPLRLTQIDENAEYAVTAIGIGDYIPIIGSDELDGFYLCDEGGADDYSITLPTTGAILPTLANAQWIYSGIDVGDILIGEFESNPGEMVILVEMINAEATTHEIELDVTNLMAASGVPLTAYALGAAEGVDPTLSQLDAEGNVALNEAGDPMQCDDWGESAACPAEMSLNDITVTYFNGTINATETDAVLQIPLDDKVGETIRLQVETNQPGDTLLVIHLGTGTARVVESSEATAIIDETTGAVMLMCDDETVFENGILLTLPQNLTNAVINVVGINDVVPAIGILDDNNEGTCILPEDTTSRYDALLPSLEPNSSLLDGIQASVQSGQHIVIGDTEAGIGQFLILVEGGEITNNSSDTYELLISESMLNSSQPLTTYMLATEELNPLLTIVGESGDALLMLESQAEEPRAVICDDAGAGDVCWNTGVDLSGSYVTLSNGDSLNTLDVDAMISLPINLFTVGQPLLLESGASPEDDPMTVGQYVLVLHIALN